MALSSVTYTGDGTTTQFSVPFQYLFPADVSATVNSSSTTFTFINPGLIAFASAPANGAVIIIVRQTNITTLDVAFTDGSTVQASDINTAELQALYLAQEAKDDVQAAVNAAAAANAAVVSVNAAIASLTTAVNNAVATANAAATTANAAAAAANAAVASIAATVAAIFTALPTTLPGTSGQLWNNGGVVSIS